MSAFLLALLPVDSLAEDIDRGQSLVTIMGCTDSHTPGHVLGQPDMARFPGGSEVGCEIPGTTALSNPRVAS